MVVAGHGFDGGRWVRGKGFALRGNWCCTSHGGEHRAHHQDQRRASEEPSTGGTHVWLPSMCAVTKCGPRTFTARTKSRPLTKTMPRTATENTTNHALAASTSSPCTTHFKRASPSRVSRNK